MNWIPVVFGLLVACGPSDEVIDRDEDGIPSWEDKNTDDALQEQAAFDLVATWTADTLTFDIYGSQGAEFYCGIAETGVDDGWTEESCISSQYCHPCGTVGTTLSLGGDPDNLEEGAETAFTDNSFEPGVTYYAENRSTQACWAWGHDPYYYIVDMLEDCEIFSN
ncbi:MAG: hypothetical protein P8R54_16095 [Myxococcota bacterium]|nr:hypothetical protein [Myxococcota bacterium]